MSKNDGKPFEKLTARVFEILTAKDGAIVQRDVKLNGADGPRQIDVLVRSQIGDIDIVTIIECRDHSRKLDIGHVDALHSKMQDVRAQKAVLISPIGFSSMAKSKADRLGISLCELSSTAKNENGLEVIGTEVPILMREVFSLSVQFSGVVETAQIQGSDLALNSTAKVPGAVVNGVFLADRVHQGFLSGELSRDRNGPSFHWIPPEISRPYFWGNEHDDPKIPISEFELKIDNKERYYFGYASQLDNSVIFKNLSRNSRSLIFELSDVSDLRDQFTRLESREEIPIPESTIEVQGITVPELSMAQMKVFGIKKQ
ncbi:restriction endonuclease [Sphingorhabdus sp. Alg231-15]|uniref:restriction endonuclease n=1 Tax=Sphingorhabdus sp. Alg231-15 TaxID=1922222 RepID=UPI000D55E898